jgi:hypothetical protein
LVHIRAGAGELAPEGTDGICAHVIDGDDEEVESIGGGKMRCGEKEGGEGDEGWEWIGHGREVFGEVERIQGNIIAGEESLLAGQFGRDATQD